MSGSPPSRRSAPRARVELPLTLARARGNPVECRTVDLGQGGMCVAANRPLGVDELLEFELPLEDGSCLCGHARVVRQQGPLAYALRFERLPADVLDGLSRLVGRRLEAADTPRAG